MYAGGPNGYHGGTATSSFDGLWDLSFLPVEIAIVTDKVNHLLNLQPFQRFGQLTVLGVGVAAVALEVGMTAELHPEFSRDIRGRQG